MLVSVYVGAPDVVALRERIPWVESAIAEYGAAGLLVVIDERANGALPDRAFREESRSQTELFKGKILFSASVIEGQGVLQMLVRTFLRSLAVVVATDIPVRLFDGITPAAQWAEAKAKQHGGPSAADLERAVAMLRP